MFLNKKPSPGLAIVTQIILIFGILSCNSYNYKADSLLEKALQDAGTNRVELEKVLNHYSSAKDSLKLKSAIFLIKYMPGKYAKVFPEYDSYTPVFDTLAKLNEEYEKIYKDDHAEFYKHYKKTALDYFLVEHHIKRSSDLIFEIKEDIKTVTADYLIENIDYAFKAWQMPWNRSLRFSDFCEFMLPYRYGNEELQPWRKAFYEENIHLLDSFKNDKDPVSVCMYLKGLHDVSRSEMSELRGLGDAIRSSDLIRINTTTSCKDESGSVLLRLRALGIPVARLTFPNWGNWGSGHDINGLLTPNRKWMFLSGGTNKERYSPPKSFTAAKLFAEIYSTNERSEFMEQKDADIYDVAPNCTDVTREFIQVSDLTLPFANQKNGSLACLCVYNNTGWKPVVSSVIRNGSATFPQIGRGIIYTPAVMDGRTVEIVNKPFLLDSTGSMNPIGPLKTSVSIRLFRKYPPNDELNKMSPTLNGSYFEGSNDSAFTSSKILWKISNVSSLHRLNQKLHGIRYQYIRLVFPEISRMNEALGGIEIKGTNDSIPLKGEPISSTVGSKIFYSNVFDNDPLTFIKLINEKVVDFRQFYNGQSLVIPDKRSFWIGLKLNKIQEITSLEISPRTDDNDVNRDEQYELFYWNDKWVSLGVKSALADDIYFLAPKDALYLLTNKNKGKENRIFLYKDGKQIWY